MKRLLIFLAACAPCMSLACSEASDAWRTPALIVLGVLSVALLIAFGRPSAKKQKREPDPPEEAHDPVEIFEEPEQESEVPKHDS